jgi:hypothetical protein
MREEPERLRKGGGLALPPERPSDDGAEKQ